MKQSASAAIAWRYLISKKSHSAVGAISAVSICGMAIATAAIICVLSVFNGFRNVIGGRLDAMSPDVMITPLKGKVFENADSLASLISQTDGVALAVPSITDNALALCGSREMPVTIKGVDIANYRNITALDSLIIDTCRIDAIPGSETGKDENTPSTAVFSIGVASGLGALSGTEALLFTPRRIGRVNMSNPASSFLTDSVLVTQVYRSDQAEYDENMVIVDIETARNLLQYDSEASAIEIAAKPGYDIATLCKHLEQLLGSGYVVKDRMRQQEMNFRMISIEKWVTFLLLFFILVIASFNIISSLSMLVIEKENSIATLRALGMSRRSIGSVFFWESVFVTSIGGVSGVFLGVGLTLLQEHFGLIKLQGDPSTLTVTSYPVQLDPNDILLTFLPVIVIGIASALITAAFARSKSQSIRR